jgi:hypothetical protein
MLNLRIGAKTFDMSNSDQALGRDLETELRATVPGFMWVEGVDQESGLVLFSAMPRDEWQYYTQEFSVRGGVVKLKGEAVEVEPTTRFEPIGGEPEPTTAEAASGETHAPGGCGCGQRKENEMAATRNKERAAALIASKKNGFTDLHVKTLEAMSEEELKAIEDAEAQLPDPAAPPAPPAQTAPTVEVSVQAAAPAGRQTMEQFEATAPPELVAMARDFKAASEARRTNLVGRLKTAQSEFNETDLGGMPLVQLEKMANLLKLDTPIAGLDFSGYGVPRALSSSDEAIPAPPSLRDAAMNLRKQQSS